MRNTETQVEAAVRCSIILAAGSDFSKLSAYLLFLSEARLPLDHELVVINDRGLKIDEKQLTTLLPTLKVLHTDGLLSQEQLFHTGAMAAKGKFLLFVRGFVKFDKLLLEESIKDLENSGEKMSISANGNFVLAERFHCANVGEFGELFAGLNLTAAPQREQSSDTGTVLELPFTGERQVGRTLDDIEQRHRLRYTFAAFYIDCCEKFHNNEILLADVGCGVGYGSYILAHMLGEKIKTIYAFDIDEPTIKFANRYYSDKKINYCVQDCGPEALSQNLLFSRSVFDVITCFEFLEHIDLDQSRNLLDLLLVKSNLLLASLPVVNGSKFHKFSVSEGWVEKYFNDAVARCPVRKRIMHKFLQNGTYFVFVIGTAYE